MILIVLALLCLAARNDGIVAKLVRWHELDTWQQSDHSKKVPVRRRKLHDFARSNVPADFRARHVE